MRIHLISSVCLMASALISTSLLARPISDYQSRYPLKTASEKLVDNRGDGFEPLYGTRNVRAVLNGVYYRGGANNYYHRKNPRSNQNPLPTDGLENLCMEGFTQAVYLYTKNFSTAPHSIHCQLNDGTANTLIYTQISVLSASAQELTGLMQMIYARVKDPSMGPVYDHCWNGWHASGLVAAYALQQFCGFTNDQAVSYWNLNTDGNNVGSSYEAVRQRIRAFQGLPGLDLTPTEQALVCPDPTTLKF